MKESLFPIALVACVATACGTSSTNAGPPPDLRISSITVAGTPADNVWSASNPVALTLGCHAAPAIVAISPTPVDSMLGGFKLAPPGACDVTLCGWLVLHVDPSSDSSTIATWTAPITVDDPLAPGAHVFAIELHDSSDRVLLNAENTAIGETVTVNFVAPATCPVTPDGADAGTP